MRTESVIRTVSTLVAAFALDACASVEKTIVAEPGVTFSLPVGGAAVVRGSDATITFRRVTEDSRCPTSVTCVWAGDARIEITVTRNGGAAESRLLSLTPPDQEAQFGDFAVRFVGLTPYPATPEPSAPRRYVAELVIRTL
jgi:hypothetical protein